MTVVRPNSIAGINSITVQTGQALNIHDADGNLIRSLSSSSGVSTYQGLHVGAGTTNNTQGLSIGVGASIVQNTANELHFFTSGTNHFAINNEGQLTCQGSGSQINLTKSGSDATEVTAALYTSNSGTHNQVTIKTSTNNGGDPFIKFDGGGQDMIVGERYVGTTNNLLVLGPGSNPDTTKGIFVKGTGSVGINTASPEGTLAVDGSIAISSSSDTVTPAGYDLKIRSTTSKLGIHCVTSGGTPILEFGTGGSTGCCIFNADATPMRLGTVNTERMRIRGDGRISIGSSLAVTGVCTAAAFVPTDTSLGNRRVNLNGAMQLWQRSTSASDIGGSNGYFAADRYRSSNNGSGRHTISRDTDEPGGFAYSMKIDVTTAVSSPGSTNYTFIQHRLEGQDVQAFAKGTSSAKEYALSFWVKSPKTGVHVVQWEDVENTRSVSGTYTIASANTWEKHTIIFPADTSGGITNDNAHRMQLYFWLFAGSSYNTGSVGDLATTWGATGSTSRASGQVNCFDNTSNNFYITGIQLEVGSYATPFEHVRYDEELVRCKRYFKDWSDRQFFANRTADSSYDGHVVLGMFDINMRTNPTVSPNTVYGRQAGESGWTDGSTNEAAGIHHDPSSTWPGRWFLLTGTWNWHSGYNDTIAVKFHAVKFDAAL